MSPSPPAHETRQPNQHSHSHQPSSARDTITIETMDLPRHWTVLRFANTEKRYYFGSTSADPLQLSDQFAPFYNVYLTDFSFVWLCDVSTKQLKSQAIELGFDPSALVPLYGLLVDSLRASFRHEDTTVTLESLKFDQIAPLQLTIKMSKVIPPNTLPFTWEFRCQRLPDLSALAILKNLLMYEYTVSTSLMNYGQALVNELEKKDNLIRVLKERMTDHTKQIIENGSFMRASNTFNEHHFKESWRTGFEEQNQHKDIWDHFLAEHNRANVYEFGVLFKDNNMQGVRKRQYVEDQEEGDVSYENSHARLIRSPVKRSKPNVEQLSGTLKDDLRLDPEEFPPHQEQSQSAAHEQSMSPKEASTFPSSPTPQGSEAQGSASPEDREQKEKRKKERKERKRNASGFGVSMKRKAYQKTYSPIKAARIE